MSVTDCYNVVSSSCSCMIFKQPTDENQEQQLDKNSYVYIIFMLLSVSSTTRSRPTMDYRCLYRA